MKVYIENIGDYLKSHDIKPSYQRIKVFEYLMQHKNHPTVDMIYKSLVDEIPTLSKTTVYNTLNLFIEKQIAVVIVIEENETRYDVDINFHGHFKCETCGCVIDVDIDPENINFESLNEFQINEHHLYFKGICKNCLEKKKI
ncbi:MAG: transcriptional repressor [Fusobacteriaceae bacterium]|jgi:Fe2+ or Zn2+ uptake regulation protein|nr:transcriptional repressor [Fusobacteriaceae bacterium]MBP6467823.1 transcriptional repressor [Fusobacteriaceae bacterium]MBP9539344.1 transcriptional repressor [Leptotrichiaceae bacterium]MBU9919110.1 transcriptional repressor [Fusobacteriaceae bacterium]